MDIFTAHRSETENTLNLSRHSVSIDDMMSRGGPCSHSELLQLEKVPQDSHCREEFGVGDDGGGVGVSRTVFATVT